MTLKQLTIAEAHKKLVAKECSATELAQAYSERADSMNTELNSFITLTPEQMLSQAKVVDDSGNFDSFLAGVPCGIKDLFCTAGVRTTAGSKILENFTPPYSATSVERIFNAGATMVGKLNLDEFACGTSNETSYYGPVKNPWDTDRVPGGSSGGSAAAVAADQVIFALGTDTGGSIRQPASLSGVVGLKPTYGSVSRYGVVAMASSLDQVGPLTKTVEDAALVLDILVAKDPKDATTVQRDTGFTNHLHDDLKGTKIGIPKEFFGEGLESDVKKKVEDAAEQLKSLGAELVDVSLPMMKYGLAVYYVLMPSELSANLARYDGVKFGYSADKDTLLENYLATRQEGFGPEIRRRIMIGTYALSSGFYDAYYRKAQQVRTLVIEDFDRVFKEVDCLLTPTSPIVAFGLGEKTDDPLAMYLADIYTVPVNIAGLPGISLPCGFVKPSDGEKELPVGLQLIGKRFDEARILNVAHQYEQSTDWHRRVPEMVD